MRVVNEGHPFHYEMEHLTRMFYPADPVEVFDGTPAETRPDDVITCRQGETLAVRMGGEPPLTAPASGEAREDERRMAVLLYRLLSGKTGMQPPWGILTGVRPIKLVREAIERGMTPDAIRADFAGRYLIAPERIELAIETEAVEREMQLPCGDDRYSLYVGIPFCPSRCSYCSFISQEAPRQQGLIDDYVDHLRREIEETARIAAACSLHCDTIYIGGGTPTTLSASQMARLCGTIAGCYDLGAIREFTVEAGRPDTITEEKLRGLLDAGVSRISINPQTLDDRVLESIGRRHTARETIDAFHLARAVGMDNINMDLIAGLPGDTPEGFSRTLDGIFALEPDSITVHTLSIKRSSRYGGSDRAALLARVGDVGRMLAEARTRMAAGGYRPYYLYRQKNTMGNLENVGYARPGKEGLYNVLIMDERHSILATGAGASTKLVTGGGEWITRIHNYKYPAEYLGGFSNILERKRKVAEFYEIRQPKHQTGGGELGQ